MFGKAIRDLKALESGIQLPVELPLDDQSYLDRKCPSPECNSDFKVLFADWRDKVRDEEVFCPVCGHTKPADEWNTAPQQEYLDQLAIAYVSGVLDQAIEADCRSFNSGQVGGGLIRVSLSYRPEPRPIIIPPNVAEELRQLLVCPACGCNCSSLGAAFFCPACGHNSAEKMFATSIQTVRTSVTTLDQIRQAVETGAGKDEAENAVRQLLEDGLTRLVASFQRRAESLFYALPQAASFSVRRNVFQNLPESSRLWKDATGYGYEDMLDACELGQLIIYFQQRHLLAHCGGIVDQAYLDNSHDQSFTFGQKLIVKEASVLRLAELIEKLVNEIDRLVNSTRP